MIEPSDQVGSTARISSGGPDLSVIPGPDASPLLDVRGVRKVFTGRGRTVEAVRDVTFSVPEEQFVCVVGPSGAGKTTLLKCIAGLMRPTAGVITLEGRTVDGPPPGMAVVFQEYGRSLFPWLTAEQNVDLPLRHKRLTRSRRRQLVADALEAVSLADAHRAYPWQLSGGMQQRVAIARAIAYEPRILLMDEPFAAVDAQTRAELEDLVLDLCRRFRMTVLFVTHDIDEAVYLSQRVIVLSASPTVVQDDLAVDLPRDRDQIATRASPRFTELRSRVWAEIRAARGQGRPPRQPEPGQPEPGHGGSGHA